jgi:phosphoribosylanthranilate isomerase
LDPARSARLGGESLEVVKVKVCGITNLIDAERALEFGADMLGFNFYPPSPRCIAPEKAREIMQRLPAGSFNVALFVNAARARVREVVSPGEASRAKQGYRALQFHGEESADFCRGWDLQVIKAFRMREKASLAGIGTFPADFCLLDSWTEGYGGSGSQFPWEWLEGLDAGKIILSGGLSTENVAQAIQKIHPFGVDVCSGVEARPGIKDHVKLKEFISAAKAA